MLASHETSSRFPHNLWLTLTMLLAAVITFDFYVYSEKKIDAANELRLQSFWLADELRQSSDDLTRMVRTYIVTGNPIYKQHFQEILQIRDGKKPRPLNYHTVYWDLVLKDELRPSPTGKKIALLELMQQAGFTQAELAKLAQAKAKSDQLAKLESEAMTLIESTHPTTESNRHKAFELLFGTSYHQAKAEIMQPIREFNQMMEQRTQQAVQTATNTALQVRKTFIVLGLLQILTLWFTYRALHSALGCSVT
jgi:hypothetical protein